MKKDNKYEKCALYIRVSTDDQKEYSPDAQKRALSEYANKNGYIVSNEFVFIDEGISGTTAKKRPAFQKMIATAKKKPKPFDAILVHKFDRFARSREDSIVYKSLLRKECDIKVISITEQFEDDKTGVILEAMLEAMAEYYSLNLSDEVMKGMSEKALRGEANGKPPYGYKVKNKKYVINEEEASTVRYIFNMIISDKSARNIAKMLNNQGVPYGRKGKWDSRDVIRVIKNESYTGSLTWNKTKTSKGTRTDKAKDEWITVENAHDPIVSEDLFKIANIKLKRLKPLGESKRPYSAEVKHFLSGLLRCKYCGGTLVYSKNNNRTPYNFFQCGNYRRGSCKHSNSVNVKTIESLVLQAIERDIRALSEGIIKINVKDNSNNELVKIKLENDLGQIETKLKRAKEAYVNGIDTIEEYKENKMLIASEKASIENELKKMLNNEIRTDYIQEKATTFMNIMKSEEYNEEYKNDILKEFITSIVVDNKEKKIEINYYID